MAGLQDSRVKQPNSNRSHDLNARQRVTGKKAANDAYSVKRKTPPQQTRDHRKQIRQRRQMIKDRMQMVRLQLALLQQVHHARYASERERTIGNERQRRVKFKPGI